MAPQNNGFQVVAQYLSSGPTQLGVVHCQPDNGDHVRRRQYITILKRREASHQEPSQTFVSRLCYCGIVRKSTIIRRTQRQTKSQQGAKPRNINVPWPITSPTSANRPPHRQTSSLEEYTPPIPELIGSCRIQMRRRRWQVSNLLQRLNTILDCRTSFSSNVRRPPMCMPLR